MKLYHSESVIAELCVRVPVCKYAYMFVHDGVGRQKQGGSRRLTAYPPHKNGKESDERLEKKMISGKYHQNVKPDTLIIK